MKSSVDVKILTANEITDVKDIRKNLLYTKSGYVIGFLRLGAINIDLLNKNEIRAKCNALTATFKAEKKKFSILSIPRTVDMEEYLNFLSQKQEDEIESFIRKKILNIMIKSATDKVVSGKNYEHQHYLKVWEKADDNSEINIENRLTEMSSRYETIQVETKRVGDADIIKLCNMYANSNSAIFEDYQDATYVPLPVMI